MNRKILISYSVVLMLVLSGCQSQPVVAPRLRPQLPPLPPALQTKREPIFCQRLLLILSDSPKSVTQWCASETPP